MIEIISHNHANELISLSGAYLEQNESENNLPLGLAYRLVEDPHYYGSELPFLLSMLESGKTVGVAIMTPPHRIILSRISIESRIAMVHLIRHLRSLDTQIPGVVGPSTESQVFSYYWTDSVPDISSRLARRSRVFEARKVADVPLSLGKLRFARMDDRPLMARWITAFSEEIGEPVDLDNAKSHAERCIRSWELYVWDLGEPVSIVRAGRSTRNGVTINTVYTPPEHRNKGYATSCV